MDLEKLKRNVLLELCCHALDWMYSVYPLSSNCISNSINEPLKDVRRVLQILKTEGYIESCKVCYVGEERNCLMNGWRITNNAVSTEEYKIACQKEEEYLEKMLLK